MKELRYTLISDGSSDEVLIPILNWLLRDHYVHCAIQPEWADLRWLRDPPKDLSRRIALSLELYPCDLLFVHRDAEGESLEVRIREICSTVEEISENLSSKPAICVVPVRMQEAWLLFDETSLRKAAGNPHGRVALELPNINQLEQTPDPKRLLYELLRIASGLRGRRRRGLRVNIIARRVSQFIEDFSPLRALPAFNALENQVESVVSEQGWSCESNVH